MRERVVPIFIRCLIAVAGTLLSGLLFVRAVVGYFLSSGHAALHYGAVLSVIILGLVVWRHRPDSRTGILLTAAAFAYALSELPVVFARFPLHVTVGLAAIQLSPAIFAHAFLSYPTGRLASPIERGFVGLGYLFALVYALPLLLFYDPRTPHTEGALECPACAVPLTHVGWRDVSGLRDFLDGVLLVLIVCFVAVLVRKLVRAGGDGPRVVLPLAAAASIAAVELAVQVAVLAFGVSTSFWTSSSIFWVETGALVAVPLALAIGLLWGRSAPAAVLGRPAAVHAVLSSFRR